LFSTQPLEFGSTVEVDSLKLTHVDTLEFSERHFPKDGSGQALRSAQRMVEPNDN
jgi:hypothetical protein